MRGHAWVPRTAGRLAWREKELPLCEQRYTITDRANQTWRQKRVFMWPTEPSPSCSQPLEGLWLGEKCWSWAESQENCICRETQGCLMLVEQGTSTFISLWTKKLLSGKAGDRQSSNQLKNDCKREGRSCLHFLWGSDMEKGLSATAKEIQLEAPKALLRGWGQCGNTGTGGT